MDLATVLADKSLLASLSREYELLKATHGAFSSTIRTIISTPSKHAEPWRSWVHGHCSAVQQQQRIHCACLPSTLPHVTVLLLLQHQLIGKIG